MTHKSQIEDPLYKNWVKGGLSSKYLKEGIEQMINNATVNIQRKFLSDVCNHLSLTDAKCTVCTTANCLPCPTKGICNITGKGRDRKCSYHIKGDAFKEHTKCPNDICDSLHTKITSQHRNERPAWQNTDATQWCTDHWEIAKCFLPGSGYADKTSAKDTDCSGLLNLAVNCLDVQTHLDLYLAPPHGTFSQILNFRNKIFHSASLSLTTEELEEHIDLMISVLQDKKELEQDPQAQTAVLKLIKLKDEGFFISTKDEEEIRQESIVKFQQEIKDDYLGRKQELQDSLCKMYEEHFKTIPISPLLDDIEAEIDDVFVELVLCDDSIYSKDSGEYIRQNGRKIKNYKDIFFYNYKSKCKNIYIIGDAGMGKSTWCIKLLNNWVSAKTRCYQKPDHHSNPMASTQSGKNDGQQIPENVDVFIDEENQLDQKIMAEFEIVLFVALRHASEDGNIRDMIKNQLFEEKAHLDDLATEVLKKEPEKCLIIVDGLDEWTRPVNVKCNSLLQHPSLPGRKGLNGCPILTTTRPWKLNNIHLQSKDIDKTIKIQGIEDVGLLAKKLINCKNKTRQMDVVKCERSFKMFDIEVQRAFQTELHLFSRSDMYASHFLRIPLILIFMVCSWYDNGHLENTMAGNFNGFIKCLFSAAEKDENSRNKGRLIDKVGIESLKKEWSKYSTYLPRSLQEIEHFSEYSQLLIKFGKLAFDSLFTSNNVSLVFKESQLRSKLTITELEVAVKVGILSQSKVVGKTLTHMSSLSFLHKTIQEYLAAVYLCSSADGYKEAIQIYANCCERNDYGTTENVRKFVIDINLSIINELCKHFAKHDVLSANKVFHDRIKRWTIEIKETITSESDSCYVYVAVLSGSDQQTLELNQSDFLDICRMIPDENKEDDDIIDIENTLTWCPQSPQISNDQLRTVQILQVNKKFINGTELCKLDLSHCKHLEDVSFTNMHNVQILINHINLTNIKLENISTSDIHVVQTATRVDCHVKQVKMIHIRNSESCKLSLPAVFWKIDMLNIIECQNLVIKIDPVMDTSVTNRHVITTVYYKMSNAIGKVKMELENELKIDTLILHSSRVAQNINIRNPFFAYIPSSLIFDSPLNCSMFLSESLCQIAQCTNLKCLMLISKLPNYTVMAKCIRKMKQLVKLHIDITFTRDGTREIMRALQSLPRLEDIGLIMNGRTADIVAEYLPCMAQLKILKLFLLYSLFDLLDLPDNHRACSTSFFKLNNIEKLEMKCSIVYDMNLYENCSYKHILLYYLPQLSKQKHLDCDLYGIQCVEALSKSLPKMVDLETLCLTNKCGSLEEVFYFMKHLTKLKYLKCILQDEQEIQALSKSVLTMTDLETLDITLRNIRFPLKENWYTDMLYSLQGLPQLKHLKCDRKLQQGNMTALLKSIPKLVNLETLRLKFDCTNQSLNKSFSEMFSLNGLLKLVIVYDSSPTGYGVMPSISYTAKYFSSYSLPRKNDYHLIKIEPYWELKRKQENISNI